MKDVIESTMLKFIGENYGSQEMDDPCYDIEKMAIEITNAIEELNKSNESEMLETHEL